MCHFRHVFAMLVDVLPVLNEFVSDELFDIRACWTQFRDPVDDIVRQMKTVQVIQYHHVKWGCGGALFLVTTHMQVLMVGSVIGEAMNQPGITMIGKDNGLVRCEQAVEFLVGQTVRMLFP